MEDKLLVKKRCFDFAFEPKTETESEEDVIIRGVIPKKFRLFGVDIVIQPTIKQEFPDDGENTNPTIALLDYIKSTLGGDLEISDVQILMQKKLERSDMESDQSRLSIPGKKIKNTDFLTDSEKGWLEGNKSKVWVEGKKKPKIEKNALSVKVFGSSLLPEHDLDLVRWDYAKNKNGEKRGKRYVLNNGWNQFREENGLEEGQKILLLSFRHKGRLCFAIVSLEKEKEEVIKKEEVKEKKMEKKKVKSIQSYAAGLSWKKSGRPRSRRILV